MNPLILLEPAVFESYLKEIAPQVYAEFGLPSRRSTSIVHCLSYPLISDQLFDLHIPHWGFFFNDGNVLAATEGDGAFLVKRDRDGLVTDVADALYYTFPKVLNDAEAAALLVLERIISVTLHMDFHHHDSSLPSVECYAHVEQDGYSAVVFHSAEYTPNPFAGKTIDALAVDGERYAVVPFKKGAGVGAVDPMYRGPILIKSEGVVEGEKTTGAYTPTADDPLGGSFHSNPEERGAFSRDLRAALRLRLK